MRIKRTIAQIVKALVVILAIWLLCSHFEIMVKAVGENPEYSRMNLIVGFVNCLKGF